MLHLDKETFKEDYREKFIAIHGKDIEEGTDYNKYEALGSLVRDYVAKMWIDTNKKYSENDKKQVYYFSMEFLLGRLLGNTLLNLGIKDMCKEALYEMGIDLGRLEELEEDQGLGNGGLGRLAACFLDSMASLSISGHGCGIRYKYGFFNQKIINDSQVEVPDNWLKNGNVWEIKKSDKARTVKFGGEVKVDYIDGYLKFNHINYEEVLAIPYDIPIVGYKNNVVNTLRLWSAEPLSNEFDFSSFNRGDFRKAIEYRNCVEAISEILYPDDSFYEGKLLRLKQQYFFVSAGIQSIIHHFKSLKDNIYELDEKISIHINDTHPALAIPELMRIFIDEEGIDWDTAWRMTNNIISYTNHTIMTEALEKWSVDMFKNLLPRIFMIVEEINKRFREELQNKYPNQWDKINRMSIINDGYINMAHLAIVGSHSINGVAKLHTEILKKHTMADFFYYYPNRFNNKTNGISHRRWLINSNPKLALLLKNTIGDSFIVHPIDMINFEKFAEDKRVQAELRKIKLENKNKLTELIYKTKGIKININSIFDVQIKRIHAYKRQLLNCLRIMDLYNMLIDNPNLDIVPRTFIFAGKSAPSYYLAKDIITLINVVADRINEDKRVNEKIKVVFMENYRVSLAEAIIPAADLSEQISTTTKEASGTSNMKFMMNGAITIATLDGANVEIRDEVGNDNIVIFGITKNQVLNYYKNGGYSSQQIIATDIRLKRIINSLVDGTYSKDKNTFKRIYDNLVTYNDEFFVIKDFYPYLEAQKKVDELYKDNSKWQKMCAINIAHSGIFSSDRTIKEYATGIWGSKCLYKNLE